MYKSWRIVFDVVDDSDDDDDDDDVDASVRLQRTTGCEKLGERGI